MCVCVCVCVCVFYLCRVFVVAHGILASFIVVWLSSCSSQAWLPCGTWDLSLTGDQTHVLCIARQILNHCTTREVLFSCFLLP